MRRRSCLPLFLWRRSRSEEAIYIHTPGSFGGPNVLLRRIGTMNPVTEPSSLRKGRGRVIRSPEAKVGSWRDSDLPGLQLDPGIFFTGAPLVNTSKRPLPRFLPTIPVGKYRRQHRLRALVQSAARRSPCKSRSLRDAADTLEFSRYPAVSRRLR